MEVFLGILAALCLVVGILLFTAGWMHLRAEDRREFESAFRKELDDDLYPLDPHEQRWRQQQAEKERERQKEW